MLLINYIIVANINRYYCINLYKRDIVYYFINIMYLEIITIWMKILQNATARSVLKESPIQVLTAPDVAILT